MIAGIVLAAGESKRMGRPKQLIDLGGRTMLQWVVDAAIESALDQVYVVIGCEADRVKASLAGWQVEFVLNEGYREGLGSSVRVGMAALPAGATAAMFLLADQPGVTAELIDTLLARSISTNIVAPLASGRRANPIVFGSHWFAELARCSGDSGGRTIVEVHPEALLLVETDADLRDVDTPQDVSNVNT